MYQLGVPLVADIYHPQRIVRSPTVLVRIPLTRDFKNSLFASVIGKMWAEQPNWSDAQLKAIDTPVLVVDGDHDEAIKREHTEYIAATIPHAGLLILPNTSHFAFLQDPRQFNFAILHFLGNE